MKDDFERIIKKAINEVVETSIEHTEAKKRFNKAKNVLEGYILTSQAVLEIEDIEKILEEGFSEYKDKLDKIGINFGVEAVTGDNSKRRVI